MNISKILSLVIVAFSLSACATSGAIYSDVSPTLKPIPSNKARLFVYRENTGMGAAIQPGIYLDGIKIGDSVPNSFIMKDIDTGKHQLSIETEVEKKYDFVAEAKKSIYIRQAVGMGWLVYRIHIEPVSAEEAASEIATLHQQTNTGTPVASESKASK